MIERMKRLSHILPMYVTFKHLFKPPITIQYPEVVEELPPRYRARHRFVIENCMSCGACARACPNQTIRMKLVRVDEKKVKDRVIKKKIQHPEIYYGRCMFCGLCVEACPAKPKALVWSNKEMELAEYTREELFYPYWRLAGLSEPPEEDKQ
ncbi:MAG TPA: NADH-quinone oxidoreductase subunit I [Euryarchaeota archaeon]|nr:NAD(P)H-quinone oxidoreductase subunit I [archaeon BMS3Bbin15]HDL14845.1 NADH-quinone oxidoreductase subunit I [Euryarchaeota archaeon]